MLNPATMLNMLASPSFRITEASVRVQCIRYYSRWITKWLKLVAAGRQLLQRDRRPWSCSTRSFSPRIFHATRTKEIKENKRSSKEICNVVLFQKFRTFLLNCMSNKGLYYKSGMLLMYISGVNNCLQGQFPNEDVLKTACVNGS